MKLEEIKQLADEISKKNLEDIKKGIEPETRKIPDMPSMTERDVIPVRERSFRNPEWKKLNTELKDFMLSTKAVGTAEVAMPVQFHPYIAESLEQYGLRKYCTVVSDIKENQYAIQRTETKPSAGWSSEGASGTNTSMSAHTDFITVKKLSAPLPVANRMFMFENNNWMNWLQNEAAKALAKAEDISIVRGDGSASTPFTGIYNDSGANFYTLTTAASAGIAAVTYSDLVAMESLITAGITIQDTAWVTDNSEMKVFRNVKDSQGMPIFRSETQKITPLEYEIRRVDTGVFNPYTTTTTGSKHFVLGNFKECIIAEKGYGLFLDPYTRRQTNDETIFEFFNYEVIGWQRPGACCVVKLAAS